MQTLPETELTAIEINTINKQFVLRHSRSLKETVVWLAQGAQGRLDREVPCAEGRRSTIRQGETVALLGFNGSGKSTLLKHISGVMLPDSGTVRTRGRVAGLIEVGAGFHPDLTGRDNVYLNAAILGMTEQETKDRFDSIIEFSEIGQFIDTEVKFYSSGMYLRLAFSVAVHTDPDVFLIDEILAVGDEPFQRKCLDKIQELAHKGKTLVVVSHDLDLVSRICDRGVVLQHGNCVFDGPIRDAVSRLRGEV